MGSHKLYLSSDEMRSVGAACILVAVAASGMPENVLDAARDDQLRKHADDTLAGGRMNAAQLKQLGISLVAQAAADV